MPTYDDDDDFARESSHARWEESGRGNTREFHEIVPDDLNTVECTECGKWIFEIYPRCPYCKLYQRHEVRRRNPIWMWLAAIGCAVLLAGSFVMVLVLWLGQV
jgi:hypothetical protein